MDIIPNRMSVCLRKITIEPVLLLYMFATFMQYVAFQDLVYEKVCASKFNFSVCQNLYAPENEAELGYVQNDASLWILISTTALVIPSIISTIFLGSWGDSFGRKLPLIMPPIGGILSSIVYICVSSDNLNGPVWPIILASIFSGMFGGFVSCIMAVMSYISSISSYDNRTSRISLVEAMTFIGGTAGPFAGGALLAACGHSTVFIVIGVCHIFILLHIFIFVPYISPENNSHERKICTTSHLTESIKVCFKQRQNYKRSAILAYLTSCLIIMTATAGEMDISYLYVKDIPLKWDYRLYSYYFGLKYALGSVALIIGPYLKDLFYFEISDHAICVVGILSKFSGYLMLGYSSTTTLMFLVPVISILNVFSIPSLRSVLSKQVEPNELGKLFACVASVENVCTLLGSLLFNSLYPIMRDLYRGSIFHLAAGIQIIPLIIITQTMLWKDHNYSLLENS